MATPLLWIEQTCVAGEQNFLFSYLQGVFFSCRVCSWVALCEISFMCECSNSQCTTLCVNTCCPIIGKSVNKTRFSTDTRSKIRTRKNNVHQVQDWFYIGDVSDNERVLNVMFFRSHRAQKQRSSIWVKLEVTSHTCVIHSENASYISSINVHQTHQDVIFWCWISWHELAQTLWGIACPTFTALWNVYENNLISTVDYRGRTFWTVERRQFIGSNF